MSSSNRRRREDDGEDDFGDDDDDDSNDNDDRAAAAASSSKKPPPAKKRKKAGVSSLIDDAAEESGEENGDEDDDDEDDDDDNNDYLKDGFVVDEEDQEIETKNKDELEDSDDDEDDDADDDEGGGRARSGGKGASSKRLKKVRKMKDLDHLDDEDLALIQEAQQVDRPDAEEPQPQQHAKSVVAKTAEELRKGLFDDDEDAAGGSGAGGAATSRPAQDRQQVRVERYDEDGMDDFIEDDIGNQGEILASERRAGYEEEDEVNEAQLTEASEIFGADYLDFMEGDQREEEQLMGKSRWRERGGGADLGGDESDDDLLSEDEDLFGDDDDEEDEDDVDSGQRAEAIRLKREKRKLAKAERRRQSLVKKAAKRKAQLRRVFEPVQLVENFCTERDDDIRQKDVPERLYDLDTPFYGSETDGLTEQEERQARWIAARIHDVALELSSASMEYEKRRVLESIAAALRFVHRDKLEPAFIRMYRRDYVTSPSVLAKLYEVLDEDGEWNRLNAAMDKVDDLIKDFGKKSSGAVDDDVDLEALEQLRQELKEAQTKAEETAKQESVVKSDLDALGTVDDDDDDDELFGDEGDKDEVSQPFPFSSWSLGASMSSVRRSNFLLFGHVFCRRRRRSALA
jgi:transcription elongation factor SPT6